MEPNVLRLQLSLENNQLLSENSTTENIEWTSDQGQYKVILTVTTTNTKIRNYDILNLFLVSVNNNLKDVFEVSPKDDGTYEGITSIPQNIKGGSKIKIGAQYKVDDIIYYTQPLMVTIVSSINEDETAIDPEDLPTVFPGIADILRKFNSAKAITNIKVVKWKTAKNNYVNPAGLTIPDDDNQLCLMIQYAKEDKPTYCGVVSATLEQLGLLTEANNEDGGGGKLGLGSKLNGAKTGFAGGRGAQARRGAAVGEGSSTETGFAGGYNCKAGIRGVAIGIDASAEKGRYNIAIGDGAKSSGLKSIALGYKANCINSSSNSAIVGPETVLKNSPESIAVGVRVSSENGEGSILIGRSIKNYELLYGKEGNRSNSDIKGKKDDISIGTQAVAGERGCVAIGTNAIAGFQDVYKAKKTKNTYLLSSYVKYPTAEPASIAIGRNSKAVGHSAIALGKQAIATRVGGIAIGSAAEAGPDMKNYKQKENYDDGDDGTTAVAIGFYAKAKADGAIQLGRGTNTEKLSLKFRNTTIVKDDAVQFNLEGSGAQGVLQVKKGGTGATTQTDARKNLGIVGTRSDQTLTLADYKNGKDLELTIPAKYVFDGAPKAFVSLRTNTNFSPGAIDYYVKKTTVDKVIIHLQYYPDLDQKKNKSLKVSMDLLLIGTTTTKKKTEKK